MSTNKPTKPIDLPYLNSAREFLLEMPLYHNVILTEVVVQKTFEFMKMSEPIDAYCNRCKQNSTFVPAP
jgi:hypothetical protein